MFETLFNPQRESGEPKVRRNQRSPLRNYAGSAARQPCRTTQTSESEEPVRAVRPTLTNEGLLPTDETWGAILISSDQLFAGNENQVRETLRLVEEVTYDLTSQSVPRPDPVRFIPNQIFFLGKKP